MTPTPNGSPKRRLASAPWFTSQKTAEPLRRVLKALAKGGGETRIIGGAVRNALLGRPVADLDLATVLTPETVIDRVTRAGLAVYPTGIEHGTVTVVADGVSFEVTTLRRDVETDGRRAVVAFTTDWHDDAMRRDFTINALSADADGNIYDTVGGLADLDARRVRFIGNAGDRIREDYLRILRFFRFTSAYTYGAPDAEGLAACAQLKDGLAQLSAERIGAEMLKILVTPRAGDITAIMDDAGLLMALLPLPARAGHLLRLEDIERALEEPPDAISRRASLFLEDPGQASMLAQRLRLSSAGSAALRLAASVNPGCNPATPESAAKAQIYRSGGDAFSRAVRVAWARSGAPATDPAWTARARLAASWSPPAMPFSGADLLALGLPPGPRIGRTLKAFEAWWIEEEFPGDREAQRARLAALAEQS
ncbi:MAG: CCA tRNA nucleotidyltransferase [Hyphomicrobium sp.]